MSPLLIVSILWIFSEVYYARRRATAEGDTPADNLSLRLIHLSAMISIPLALYLAFNRIGAIAVWPEFLHYSGLVLIIGGMAVRWLAIRQLKHFFTVDVAIRAGHYIIKDGLYRRVRHPSYTGSLMSFLGLGIALVNWLSVLVIFVPVLLAFLNRIRVEETVLLNAFGDEYRAYQSATKRLLPGIY